MKYYADYEFYKSEFCGRLIPEDVFKRHMMSASIFLDEVTLNRICDVIEEVKMAACEVAEIEYREKKEQDEDQIASESVGPHSVSYVRKQKSADDYRKEKINSARIYLSKTGLMNRGISSCVF